MNQSMRITVLAIVLFSQLHPAGAADDSWNMDRERYAIPSSFHRDAPAMTLQELASGGVTLLSHVPATKEYCEEAKKWGIKICPYVSLYKVAVSGDDIPWESPCGAYPNNLLGEPFWKEIDAAKHPEWYLRREDGQIRKPFDNPNYQKCFQQSCCNHRDLIDAYERGVRNVMDLGAGGLFVDNIHPHAKCFGAELGLHTHDWPDEDNTACYKMAFRRVCDTVKSYGKDRVVILNPGGPPAQYASLGDCAMWESFVWQPSEDRVKGRTPPHSWKQLLAVLPNWRPLGERGPSIAPLTYLPALRDAAGEAEMAFFAYAVARVAGFDQWTGTCQQRRDILRRLYRVQTGPALGEPVATGEAVSRLFQNALIACNLSKETVEVRLPVPATLGAAPVELYNMQAMPIIEGHVVLSLSAESGRVIVTRNEAMDNLLREVEGQALAARLHLEKKVADPNETSTATVTKQLQDIETRAAALRKTVREATFPTAAERDTLLATCKDATAISTPSPNDPFLAERLDNLRRHADLLADLLTK